jgi:hypothetical protein
MRTAFRLSLILVISFNSLHAFADYYVSLTGSDSNPGTLASPFKTIQKAASVMAAGDTCFIMAGIYRETVTPANNGTSSGHIVFKNYLNDKVILTGTDTLFSWLPHQNGIYKAYAPDTVLQLSVDKEMANEARYPNYRGNHLSMSDWNALVIDTNGRAVFSGLNSPAGYWNGGICVANVGSKWVSENGKIDSSSGNSVYCSDCSYPWGSHPAYSPSVYTGSGSGYIIHHLNALDTVNEWHWQNDTLYYFPSNAGNINSMHVEARTRMFGFNCFGKEYIEINNIQIVWATVNFETATGCILNEASVWFPTPYYYYDVAWSRQSQDTANYGISSWSGKGVALSGYNNSVTNCYIAHSWGDGISIGGQNNTVQNCLVEDCDWTATDCGVIATYGIDHNINQNTLRKTGRSVLVNRLSFHTAITHNDMYDCGKLTSDLGITYSYHSNGGGSHIAYNWVHDNHAANSALGIYLDNFDTAYIVHHNVVWNCFNAIQTNKPAVNHEIYNNTVWACTNAMGAWGNTGTTIQNQIVKNNLSNKAWNLGTTFSNNLVAANPLFTNAALFDFTLSSTSPAIDYGTVIPGITTGFVGAAPDAGAYEYGASQWIPGSVVTAPDISEVYDDPSQVPTGLGNLYDDGSNDDLVLYPNPTKGKVHVLCENLKNTKVEVYNIFGQKVFDGFNLSTIDLSSNSNGLFLFVVTDLRNGKSYSKMVVVNK